MQRPSHPNDVRPARLDVMGFDAKTNRVIVIVIGGGTRGDVPRSGAAIASRPANEGQDAAIDLFQVGQNGELARIDSIRTVPLARTGIFVPERRAVYLAVPPQGDRDSEIREYKVPD